MSKFHFVPAPPAAFDDDKFCKQPVTENEIQNLGNLIIFPGSQWYRHSVLCDGTFLWISREPQADSARKTARRVRHQTLDIDLRDQGVDRQRLCLGSRPQGIPE